MAPFLTSEYPSSVDDQDGPTLEPRRDSPMEHRDVYDEKEHCAPTRLPYMNVSNPNRLETSDSKEATFARHDLLATSTAIVKSTRALLDRFSSFVAAVADADEVCYQASILDANSHLDSPIIHATLDGASRLRSEWRMTMFDALQSDSNTNSPFDFALTTTRTTHGQPGSNMAKNELSVLVVESEESQDTADVYLSCSKLYIPAAAATQLLQILVEYLSPGIDGAREVAPAPLSSIMNHPPISSSPPTLPWDMECEGPPSHLLHSAFERRAQETPKRSAIDYLTARDGCTSITYQETMILVNNLSGCITDLVRVLPWTAVHNQQRVVPIFMPPCPELYMATLAILKAGHAFCPLPIDAPQDRILDILHDLRSPVVLGKGKDRFACGNSRLETFDKLNETLWLDVSDMKGWLTSSGTSVSASYDNNTSRTEVCSDDLAYVYYTSGSTGRPKGVQISHLAATCSISAHAAAMSDMSSRQDLRWFQLAVSTFDPFVLDVFFTLSAGGTLCVAERDLTLTDVEGTMNALRVNVTSTVPSLAMMFRPERLKTLETILCSGEKIGSKVVESFSSYATEPANVDSICRRTNLVNFYGPTEATINVTSQALTPDMRGTIIGTPLPTASIILINEETLQAVPAGLPGHLAIGGPQLSHGYLNRPVENSKQFIHSKDFGRLYLTGDKARVVWTEQGEPVLECLGRIQDGQVKLNGRRVELEEIDSVLASSTLVVEATTVTFEASTGVQLYACIVPEPGLPRALVEDDCRKMAGQRLPQWMHPNHYFVLPTLPRSLSGKIERKALRMSAEAIFATKKSAVEAPTTPPVPAVSRPGPEQQPGNRHSDQDLPSSICRLIKECINDSACEITQTTSLYVIGFDSLRSIMFLQKARDVGISELGIQDMMKGLTPKDLAQLVSTRRRAAIRRLEREQKGAIKQGHMPKDEDAEHGSDSLGTLLSGFDDRCRLACAERLSVPQASIESVLPATYTQTRMVANFLAAETKSEPKPWVEHFVYDVPQSIDSHRFQTAVSSVLSRHAAHRTVFTLVEDPVAPVAKVLLTPACPEARIPSSNVYNNDLATNSNKSKTNMFEQLVTQVQRAADEQMCLERPPLAVTFVSSMGRCVFVLSMFHGIYDGASLKLLRQEIMMEYLRQPTPARTSIDTVTRLHFGADQKETLKFWIARLAVTPYYKLAGVPMPSTDHSLPLSSASGVNGLAPDSTHFSIKRRISDSLVSTLTKRSSTLYTDLITSARSNLRSTPLSVIQAAWALVLLECQQKADQSRPQDAQSSYDVAFGSIIHGRHDSDSQICMGPIMATVPVCIAGDTSDDTAETNSEMCQILANEHAEALEHLQIPCPSLEFAQAAARFDTTLILQTFDEGGSDQLPDLPGFEDGDAWLPAYRGSDFCIPVLLEILPQAGGIMEFRCTFRDSHSDYPWLNSTTASVLVELFDANLKWIMRSPDRVFDYRQRDTVL